MYHLSIKIISRGKGKSAVAAAAYRAGEKIINEYDGATHDYTRKGSITHTEIMLPENAPVEYQDRATLWNAVEKIEKAKNSQLAREIEIALPVELNHMQSINLVREYVRKNFTDKGMCADISIHDPKGEPRNPHAHIMLTMRPLNEDKTWGDKQKKKYILDDNGEKIYDPKKRQYKCDKVQTTDWNEQTKAEEWRWAWAATANRYLQETNHAKRLDHRSYKRQGISKIPTIHLGVAAHQMEKRGIQTERGNINRAIEISNRKLRQLAEQINELQGWLAEEIARPEPVITPPQSAQHLQSTTPTPQGQQTKTDEPKPLTGFAAILAKHQAKKDGTHPTTPPPTTQQPIPQSTESKPLTFANIITDIITRQAQGRPIFEDDKKLFSFLAYNNIEDYEGLEKHMTNLMTQQRELGHEYNPLRSRVAELSQHIRQNENYTKRKAAYNQYEKDLAKQMPWKKKSFAADNSWIVERYNEAKQYIDGVRNANGKIPLATWQKEHSELSKKIEELDGRYQILKTKVAQANRFRVRVYDVLRKEKQKTQPVQKRSQDISL